MNVQLKRGVLDLCVLVLLNSTDCYGYQLVKDVSTNIDISEGTIYPLLKRLKDEGYVTTYLVESSMGPPRKFYHLSDEGRRKMRSDLSEWNELSAGIHKLLKTGGLL